MTSRYNFLAHTMYGFDSTRQDTISLEDRERYGRAVLTIAAADGLSQCEAEYFVNLARGMDVPDEFAAAYEKYDTRSATLEELLTPLRGRHPVPYLLYDAIKVASVDGYSDKERSKVEAAAKVLGVRIETIRALEAIVAAENSVRDARLALFASIEAQAPS